MIGVECVVEEVDREDVGEEVVVSGVDEVEVVDEDDSRGMSEEMDEREEDLESRSWDDMRAFSLYGSWAPMAILTTLSMNEFTKDGHRRCVSGRLTIRPLRYKVVVRTRVYQCDSRGIIA